MSALISALALSPPASSAPGSARPPNIVFILADDLGFAELGCYGQKLIKTPHIDRLAAEGIKFRQAFAGSCVCAPSRSTLMTGLHTGHTPVRSNGGGKPLLDADITVAAVLKQAGYVTGGFGKWGLGIENTSGHPNRQGFDEFFGYFHQVHAHFYYPYYLWSNDTKYNLPANEGKKREQYSADVIHAQGLEFLRRNRDRTFFCYLPYTLPHVELVVPEDSMTPYRSKFKEAPLPDPRPGYIGAEQPYATFAGMVSRMDRYVGDVMALLKELKIDDKTIVFFSSDNGPQGGPWKRVADFFDGKDGLRGYKGDFYEGGIRVPLIVRWPGKIKPGSVSDHVCAFWDFMPTFAQIAQVEPPRNLDGISFLPALLGRRAQQKHPFLYWEIREGGGLTQAVRMGDWKAVRPRHNMPLELYDLKTDPGESTNVAAKHPDVLKQITDYMATARVEERAYPKEEPAPTVKDYVR